MCVGYLWNSGKTESINKRIETETAIAAEAATATARHREKNAVIIQLKSSVSSVSLLALAQI